MILVLNGSPNKNSKSLNITNNIIKDKHNIKIVNAYDLNITSCDDCKYCEKKIGCSKKDEMEAIYQYLTEANTLFISSPIYFGALSDKLLTIINRFQRYYGQKYALNDSNTPKIRNLILVTTQGSFKEKMIRGATLTTEILETLFEAENTYFIHSLQSDDIPYQDDRSLVDQVTKLKNIL